ncbi:hypothetical protein HAHE_42040 [Haloferula helveola]|uniref:Mechanosensitive ion channel n=1 Tax=Haloferula helveola TaxID=490095 RepID=A0ABM7REX4_9BACT|nr:hypothetical protein HAHE_42040 [Haloferula helveola]
MISFEKTLSTLKETLSEQWTGLVSQVPNLVAGLVVLLATWIAVFAYRKLVRRALRGRSMRDSLKELIVTFGKVAIWTLGVLIAAMIVFPDLTPSKALGAAGLASVAVGLAFKDIFQNFFAGILLLWRFPFEPGDFIECGDVCGRVEDTRLRMTTVRSLTGELVVVPNSQLIGNPLEVLNDQSLRRTTVETGVAYKEDLDRALELIEGVLNRCDSVDKDRPHDVFASGFGDSSMNIDVIYWTDARPYEQRRSRSEVITAIKSALDEEGIEIPFPYRTLTFDEPLPILSKRPRKERVPA